MKKRMFLMLAVVAVVLGGLATWKFQQVQAAMAGYASFQPPPEAITTAIAQERPWDVGLQAIGTVTAVHGVLVAADLPGLVERISFDSGRRVRAGEVLLTLDSRQEQAQLAAAEAQRELARLQLDRMEGLRAKGVTSQAELDAARAGHAQAQARVGEIRATIARKTIRAPFSGVLGIRQVDLGQYLAGGDPIVPLQSLDPIHVDFGVPQQEVGRLPVGTAIQLTGDGVATDLAPIEGRVTAVDSLVDASTRNVQVQATFSNTSGLLRPGMFVEVRALVGGDRPLVTVPATAVSYAPYGDSVFVVEELEGPEGGTYKGVRQQFVELGGSRGDLVAVLSGVDPGEEVATSGVFKLRQGAAVLVDNEVQPGDDPKPRPENS